MIELDAAQITIGQQLREAVPTKENERWCGTSLKEKYGLFEVKDRCSGGRCGNGMCCLVRAHLFRDACETCTSPCNGMKKVLGLCSTETE